MLCDVLHLVNNATFGDKVFHRQENWGCIACPSMNSLSTASVLCECFVSLRDCILGRQRVKQPTRTFGGLPGRGLRGVFIVVSGGCRGLPGHTHHVSSGHTSGVPLGHTHSCLPRHICGCLPGRTCGGVCGRTYSKIELWTRDTCICMVANKYTHASRVLRLGHVYPARSRVPMALRRYLEGGTVVLPVRVTCIQGGT